MKKSRIVSPETRLKISEKGKGRTVSKETRRKIGLKNKGNRHSSETKEKISIAKKGKKASGETCRKMSKARLGENNPNWKGGVTSENIKIRGSKEYKLWRTAVLERDNYSCIWCGFKGYVEADHIKQFAYFPELRFAIDNGRTLCKPCHKATDTYCSRVKKR